MQGGSCHLPVAQVAVSSTVCGEHAAQAPESGWGGRRPLRQGEEDEAGQVGRWVSLGILSPQKGALGLRSMGEWDLHLLPRRD